MKLFFFPFLWSELRFLKCHESSLKLLESIQISEIGVVETERNECSSSIDNPAAVAFAME